MYFFFNPKGPNDSHIESLGFSLFKNSAGSSSKSLSNKLSHSRSRDNSERNIVHKKFKENTSNLKLEEEFMSMRENSSISLRFEESVSSSLENSFKKYIYINYSPILEKEIDKYKSKIKKIQTNIQKCEELKKKQDVHY